MPIIGRRVPGRRKPRCAQPLPKYPPLKIIFEQIIMASPPSAIPARSVFVTGGTGYMGRRLTPHLLNDGYEVRALARPGSEKKLPAGCSVVLGDALDSRSYLEQISPAHTLIHLIGVSHPNPSKAAEFRAVDLVAAKAAITAAQQRAVQ